MNTLIVSPTKVDWSKITGQTPFDKIPEDEKDHNGWWYLHGKLEDACGYDKATTVNCKSAGYSKPIINWKVICGDLVTELRDDELKELWTIHINDIIPVKVEGIDKPCIGYFWTVREKFIYYQGKEYNYWEQRGLVCFEDDMDACEYAKQKYDERSEML